ncbi:hypothetical protein Tco_0670599 [Tanacetum coccineum]
MPSTNIRPKLGHIHMLSEINKLIADIENDIHGTPRDAMPNPSHPFRCISLPKSRHPPGRYVISLSSTPISHSHINSASPLTHLAFPPPPILSATLNLIQSHHQLDLRSRPNSSRRLALRMVALTSHHSHLIDLTDSTPGASPTSYLSTPTQSYTPSSLPHLNSLS